jgi:hypothetical protein
MWVPNIKSMEQSYPQVPGTWQRRRQAGASVEAAGRPYIATGLHTHRALASAEAAARAGSACWLIYALRGSG